ncbi:MAG TPA: hypothetical protein ENI61_04055 [Ignavibacteria bacterium]|nr:hypothetical protein [Ignavibacteria bacterium]
MVTKIVSLINENNLLKDKIKKIELSEKCMKKIVEEIYRKNYFIAHFISAIITLLSFMIIYSIINYMFKIF